MIKMWDDIFKLMNSKINLNKPKKAFNLMNLEMKKVYKQMYKALKPGGIMIVNIGDATRKIGNNFKLYPNGAKTIIMCEKIGFNTMPQIH
jgi:site-specific DNA-methyltransferase (cytosine-N4-specific)